MITTSPNVTSIAETGQTPLSGNVTLSEGTNIALTQSGQDISIATSGVALASEAFVTIGNTAGLSAERALTGTTNQITVTDNGAGSTVVLSTPQDIDTAADVEFGSILLNSSISGIPLTISSTTSSNKIFDLQGITTSSNSTIVAGFNNQSSYRPSSVTLINFLAFNHNPQLTLSSTNVTNLSVSSFRLDTSASYLGTIANYFGGSFDSPLVSGGTITKSALIRVQDSSSATNNTGILIGTSTIPTGNYGIYNASTRDNYFAGDILINTLTASKPVFTDADKALVSTGTMPVDQGGTGQTTYTNGQLLIGNTTGNTLTKATLTGTANQVIVTNSTGSITLSTPQNIATTSTPQFANIGVGTPAVTTAGIYISKTNPNAADFYGFLSEATQNVSGSLTLIGFRGVATASHTSGSISALQANSSYGIFSGNGGTTSSADIMTAYADISTGHTVTGLSMLHLFAPTNSGTIGTLLGLNIEDMTAGGTNYSILTNAGLIVFNEGGNANSDVRIEGDTDTSLFFTDASADLVGIGTSAPTRKLQITGNTPASVGTTPGTTATSIIGTTGAVGGATSIATTGTGGVGGTVILTAGAGGQATAATTASTGGVGGVSQLTTGAGGAASVSGSGTNTGGNGGQLTLTNGAGGAASGTSGTAQGGTGGSIAANAGTGGAATGTGANTGGNGGATTIDGGTGGSASGGSSNTPGNGGAITLRGGISSTVEGSAGGAAALQGRASTATGSGGAGGAVSLTGGAAAGDNTANRQGGLVGLTAGISKGTTAGGAVNLTSGASGSNQATGTSTGPNGGAIALTGGAGGTAPLAEVASTGGNGGNFSFTGGSGGVGDVDGTGTNNGGTGSAFTVTPGTGGAATGDTSGTNTGGNGGALTLNGGNGGAANTGVGNLVGGTGGAATISGGTGGIGSTSGGNGGGVTLRGGTPAAMVGAQGGAATIQGRDGSSTGTGGAGGNASLTGGAAGGDETVSRAGGIATLTAGQSRGSSAGGAISVTSGAGGIGTAALGANGGTLTLTAGTGGANATVSGNGGALALRAGLGGASGTPGSGGDASIQTAITTTYVSRLIAYGSSSGLVINEAGADYDFRIESDTDANMFVVDASANSIGIGTNAPTAWLHIKAGTATAATAPLKFTTGTLLTTAEAGAYEYLTNTFYLSPSDSNRGVNPAEHLIVLTAAYAGSDVNTAQKVFNSPTNGTLTVIGSTSYEFEGLYHISRAAGTTSHTLSVLFGGTASFTSVDYTATSTSTTGNVLGATSSIRANAATAVVVTAASTSATENNMVMIKGIIRVNAGGTLIPQFQFSAAPGGVPTVDRNSYFRLWSIGSNTVASVGNWS